MMLLDMNHLGSMISLSADYEDQIDFDDKTNRRYSSDDAPKFKRRPTS
jgi:hypothetical protein